MLPLKVALRLLLSTAVLLITTSALPTLSPIIIAPGNAGNQIWATLARHDAVQPLCKLNKNNYQIWVDPTVFAPGVMDCFVDNMRLVYNQSTHTTKTPDGVTTEVRFWGDLGAVEYLTAIKTDKSAYLHKFAEAANSWGYTRGKNLRAAPYDFRRAPNEMADYYTKLKALVEETYTINGNKPVVMIGHSLGNLMFLYFYQHQPASWKAKYLKAHIAIGAPWGGSVKTVLLMASGTNLDRPDWVVPPLKLRPMQRSWPSSHFLLPSPKFWGKNDVFAKTPTKNYTTANYQEFFDDINFHEGYQMYQDVKDLIDPDVPPGIEVHCLVGVSMITPEFYMWDGGKDGMFPDDQPQACGGPGDGTVNDRSQMGCLRWKKTQTQPVTYKRFSGREHLALVKDDAVIAYIKSVVVQGS